MLEGLSVNKELETTVNKLKNHYRLYAIILFGSRVRGDYKPWSDYDLLIIAEFEKKYMDRIGEILELLNEVKIVIEPHPYTIEEAKEMLRKGNPLIVNAISEGIVLYKDQKFSEIESIYQELIKKGLRKSNTTIIIPIENI